jgi:exopolyphosphatase/guanosine-5'-triphosphate,3'-diphosphate pyrophosphatase
MPANAVPRDWNDSVLEFARSCRFDEPHARQVSRLALIIFDALAKINPFDQRARDMLEAAALLHDIGYFISYHQHHKHSCHLIRHANIFGFTPREREIVANLARYHRKARPHKSHDNFAQLSDADQLLVSQLGGILRLADGLDRRRNRHIKEMDCTLSEGILTLALEGEEDLSVEIFGARTKGDLFEKAFKYQLIIKTREGR